MAFETAMRYKNYLYLVIITFLVLPMISALGELDLTCQNRPNMNVNEKEYCLAEIPTNYTGQSFKCISYITFDGEVIQTNPEFKEKSNTLFSFIGGDEESRESFVPANLIVNFYYTGKNLYPDKTYDLNLVCHSQDYRLTGNRTLGIDYENLDFIFARTEWAKRNVSYIVAGMFVLILLLILVFYVWRQAT